MGRSRRKYKQSRPKVRVGLPKKNPRLFKPAFSVPPKLAESLAELDPKWDDMGSVIQNYKSFGVVSNPNLLSVRSRTPRIVETDSLQAPPPAADDDSALDDSGSDLEEDGQQLPVSSIFYFLRFHRFCLLFRIFQNFL